MNKCTAQKKVEKDTYAATLVTQGNRKGGREIIPTFTLSTITYVIKKQNFKNKCLNKIPPPRQVEENLANKEMKNNTVSRVLPPPEDNHCKHF